MLKNDKEDSAELIREWLLSPAVTLGSAVRAKGIVLEVRARLPLQVRKALDIDGVTLRLVMPESAKTVFRSTSALVTESLTGIETLPVIPREIQDILTITTTERHRWLKDGRLPSGGVRTVRLRGRAKQITFHVFDPRLVEDVLDRGLVDEWREQDAIASVEKRQQAAWNRKVTKSLKAKKSSTTDGKNDNDQSAQLLNWDEFSRNGLLR